MDRKFRTGELVLEHWEIARKLREGNFGVYYQLNHCDHEIAYQTQLKVVSVPRNLKDFIMISQSGQEPHEYVDSVVSYVMEEIALQTKLVGNPHVLHYYDHKRESHHNGIGYDILIRTELLPTVVEHAQTTPLNQVDIIQMGIEISKALEVCHNYDIIHRDIQPQYIYVTSSGSFKLGDFRPQGDLPQTEEGYYMAPEMCRGEKYDHTVDIYSLALVMYQLLNRGKLAFTPEGRSVPLEEGVSPTEEAKRIRLSGAMLPPPYFAKKGRLGKILARAAHPKPELRFISASEFRQELEGIKKLEGMPVYPYRPKFYPNFRSKEQENQWISLLGGIFG